jgi:hypothetical protein
MTPTAFRSDLLKELEISFPTEAVNQIEKVLTRFVGGAVLAKHGGQEPNHATMLTHTPPCIHCTLRTFPT